MGFKEIASSILEINLEDITEELSPKTNRAWTSLKQVKLIAAVEKEYGIKFTFKEMKQLKNMKMFAEILKEKGIEVNLFE